MVAAIYIYKTLDGKEEMNIDCENVQGSKCGKMVVSIEDQLN